MQSKEYLWVLTLYIPILLLFIIYKKIFFVNIPFGYKLFRSQKLQNLISSRHNSIVLSETR